MVDLVKGDTREEDECEVNVDNDSHTDDDKVGDMIGSLTGVL